MTEQHVWGSVSLGGGSGRGSLAAALGLWYSRNALVLGLEGSSIGGIFQDEQRDATALLVGYKKGSAHNRLVAAAGLASVHDYDSCQDFCLPDVPDTRKIALAFSGQGFVNAPIIGIGLETFGAVGPGRSSFIAIGLSVQLGWLGGTR